MNATTFKTLGDARTAYDALEAESTVLRARITSLEALETELVQIRADSAVALTENENLRVLVSQKDLEIGQFKAEIEGLKAANLTLKTSFSELEKGQKTVQTAARELVAASGGVPVSVDQAEISKMQAGDAKELEAQMRAEQNPRRLGELYKQYNETFRPEGIKPKRNKK
jgi:cell division protein FtsB